MKLGAIYPQTELSDQPDTLGRFAQAVEAMGFDHMLIYDHTIGAVHADRDPPLTGPYTDADPFFDPFTALAFVAGITNHIKLTTGILILPQRQTVLAAHQAADVDLLSGGRLRLGVGTGWNYVEYEALGQDFQARGAMLNEQIPLLRRLWSEQAMSFSGRFHNIERANLTLRPNRQIPIYCGGFTEPAFRRAAKMADGFIFATFDPEREWPKMQWRWSRLQELLRDGGRRAEDFNTITLCQPTESFSYRPQEIAEAALRLRHLGIKEYAIASSNRGLKSIEHHLDFLETAKAQVDAVLMGS